MKLSEFLVSEAILVDLQATSREEAVREMVQSLHEADQIRQDEVDNVVRAIIRREELGTTGIGNGVAVPHTRHQTVDRLIGTVALSRHGVEFKAQDGEPVDILFLLISPPQLPRDHLRALSRISDLLRDQSFADYLRRAQTREQVLGLIEEADQRNT